MNRRVSMILAAIAVLATASLAAAFSFFNEPEDVAAAAPPGQQLTATPSDAAAMKVTQEDREAAADRAKAAGLDSSPVPASATALATPDYFGAIPNYANSPLPELSPPGKVTMSNLGWPLGPAFCDATKGKYASGDFDGDGVTDVAILYDYGNSNTAIWILRSNGTNFTPTQTWLSFPGGWDWNRSKLTAGDYDGDGLTDLAVLYNYGSSTSGIWIFKSVRGGNMTPTFAWTNGLGGWDWNASKLTSGDFNGDGKADVGILYDYGSATSILWSFQSNGNTMTPHMTWWNGNGGWDSARSKMTAGDFDGDGKDDIEILYNYGNATSAIWVMKSDGTNMTGSFAWWNGTGGWDWNRSKVASGEYNGDNMSDVAILYDYGNAASSMWDFQSDGTTYSPGVAWSSGPGNLEWSRSTLAPGLFHGTAYSEVPVVFDYGNARSTAFMYSSNGPTQTVLPNTGIRKFIDTLPGLGPDNANNLGKYMPVAVPDTITYPDADYYEISIVEYTEQMHTDLPATKLRGYVQTNNGTDPETHENTVAPASVHYMGPVIVANRDRPVRIKLTNDLPTGEAGDLFLPVDTTIMGAGPYEIDDPEHPGETLTGDFSQNRALVHLHGGATPWISDGTPHQWFTPAEEETNYPRGMSYQNVPDMWYDPVTHERVAEGTPGATNDPGPGSQTLYYTNQQSSRLMFYHDHAFGITRLGVYAGEAAGYILNDPVEQDLIDDDIIPADQIPLVIQDKTFVPGPAQLLAEDPTWDSIKYGGKGSLWLPHVYMPAQNPADPSGMNAMGRWHYGPWFHPPTTNLLFPPIPNPLFDCGPDPDPCTRPWEPPLMPATPNPSLAPEAFVDTPVVNGEAYPTLNVDPKAYRFRVLNAANDRFWNLQLYQADPSTTSIDGRKETEVKMVPADPTPGFPDTWPIDGRDGGVPDPHTAGPQFIQIGTESGFLPAPVVLPNQPVDWNMDQTTFNFGNVTSHTLLLGPAERGDVIVDFSQYAGQTLILYNDAPAAFPALDPRYDYYTGNPDLTDTGGAPSTMTGYGPNTRTVMQIKVADTTPAQPFDVDALNTRFASTGADDGVFEQDQDPIIVPQASYDSAYHDTFTDVIAGISDNSLTFDSRSGQQLTIPFVPKAIQDEMGEAFDMDYGRMKANLGTELLNTSSLNKNFVLQDYVDPPTEELQDNMTPISPVAGDGTQLWRITHNGVDTHTLHFHLFSVQIVNRVAWDNSTSLPDANELGWKETIRVNPLEDTIVAMRPVAPSLPFSVPGSVRPLDVTMPLGSITPEFTTVDPYSGEPRNQPTVNQLFNFGWEYVLHCHLLGHEENDMMRPLRFSFNAPAAPSGLTAQELTPGTVTLNWTNNAVDPAAQTFIIERAGNDTFTTDRWTFSAVMPAVTYNDNTSVLPATTYYYRVRAENATGFSSWSATATVTTG